MKHIKKIILTFSIVVLIAGVGTSAFAQQYKILQSMQNETRRLAQNSLPSVVTVFVENTVEVPMSQGFKRFFFFNPFGGNPEEPQDKEQTRKYQQEGLGSGVIVQQSGNTYYVLTNAHVVEDADDIELITYDKDRIKAKLMGKDVARDMAIISFESDKQRKVAALGDSGTIKSGNLVFAIGSPHGFEFSVTMGIVSAINRNAPQRASSVRGNLTEYIQTDAAVNRGNSGGPLINVNGEVIGINTWIYSQTGENAGLSFAVPINSVKQSIETIIKNGEITYGWLGILHMPALQDRMSSLTAKNEGAFVAQVYENSPANKAGILPGDIILNVEGSAIKKETDLLSTIAGTKPGSRIRISILRSGKKRLLHVILGKRDEDLGTKKQKNNNKMWPGFVVSDISKDTRDRFDISGKRGVVVTSVNKNSAAAAAGLRELDVIEKVNNSSVDTLNEFYNELNTVKSGDELLFRINRRGSIFVVGIVKD